MSNPLYIKPMSIQDAQHICTWQYEAPYHGYCWKDWTTMQAEEIEFGDAHIRAQQYFALYRTEQLAGFVQLFPLVGTIRIALFLAPSLCGQGLGKYALACAIQVIHSRYPNCDIDLEVECWNERAIACYSRSGFHITDHYSYMHQGVMKEVYCMVYGGAGSI